jgi:hypothetical protein
VSGRATGRTPAWRIDREIAPAFASAALTAPVAFAMALVASALVFRNVGWAVAACFIAGRLAGPRLPRMTMLGAVALLVAAGERFSVILDLRRFDLERIELYGLCAGALLVGARSPRLGVAAMLPCVACFLPVFAEGPSRLMVAHPRDAVAALPLAVGTFLVVVLAARRRAGAAFVVLLAAAALVWAGPRVLFPDEAFHVVFDPRSFEEVWPSFALLLVAHLAGTIAAAIDEGARADGGVGLVVFCQRRPWFTSFVLGVGVAVLAGPGSAGRFGGRIGADDEIRILSCLPFVTAAFAALLHVGRGARSTIDRFAPWLAANLATVVIACSWAVQPSWPLLLPGTIGLALLVAEWPLACAAILPGTPPGDRLDLAAAALSCLCLVPPLLEICLHDHIVWTVAAAECALAVPLVVHALARSPVRARWILLGAVAVGCAWEFARPEYSRRLVGPVVWLLVALCVLAARRCRSMTAVPRDHPIVADFGGA